jgi:hypothetical protein
MRGLLWIVPFVLLTANCVIGQEASLSTELPLTNAKHAVMMVYTMGPGVTAPELLTGNQPPIPEEKCKQKMDGIAAFLVYTNANGMIDNMNLMYSSDPRVTEFARKAIVEDHFKPGSFKGVGPEREVSRGRSSLLRGERRAEPEGVESGMTMWSAMRQMSASAERPGRGAR